MCCWSRFWEDARGQGAGVSPVADGEFVGEDGAFLGFAVVGEGLGGGYEDGGRGGLEGGGVGDGGAGDGG